MKKKVPGLFICMLVLGALFLTAGCLIEQQGLAINKLTFYTEQYPPYNYIEDGTLKGISVDLLNAIYKEVGLTMSPTVYLVSWTEGYQNTLTKNNTVLFSTARIPERELSFKWAGPIFTETVVLFAKRDRGITIQHPEDLQEYQIGVITDDIAVSQLLDLGVNQTQLIAESNVTTLIGKLETGEIDLWAYPETTGRSLAEQIIGNYYAYTVVYQLEPFTAYYAFSKDVADSTVSKFQQALDSVKEERDAAGLSKYEKILGAYIPRIGFAQLNYLTEEWAPFNYQEDGLATGISVEILEEIFQDIGVNRSRADVHIVPLAEAFQVAQQNTSTVLFSIVRTSEREDLYKWAGPFTNARFVLFAPLNRSITITTPTELNQYRIGAVQDSIENTLLTDEGVNASQIVNGQTPADLLNMLAEGQIDLWATGDLAGQHQMLLTAEYPAAYEIVYTLSENDFYFIFSKNIPDTLVSAFQNALDVVRAQRDVYGVTNYERIIYKYLGVSCARQTFTDAAVTELVNTTALALQQNASDTLNHINAGEAPYRNATDPGLYVFVYDMNLTVVAHADNILMVGKNYKGTTDVTGFPFRDAIRTGALENGIGWVEYVYKHPVQTNLFYKNSYYRLTQGSDGVSYIVGSGNYKHCE